MTFVQHLYNLCNLQKNISNSKIVFNNFLGQKHNYFKKYSRLKLSCCCSILDGATIRTSYNNRISYCWNICMCDAPIVEGGGYLA